MRTVVFTLFILVAFVYAANAQRFSLLPQVGFENSKTSVNYNELGYFAPEGVKFSPQASLRLNYSSKKGHGFFVGGSTSRSIIVYGFNDPENGMTNFSATEGNMQVRLEGGYQFNTKPIYFKNSQSSSSKATTSTAKKNCGSYSKSSCEKPTVSYSRCGSKSKTPTNVASKSKTSKGTWMRIQPSVGMAYIPSVKTNVDSKTENGGTTYEYKAGNWNTAFLAGSGFEFGKNKTRLFTVSINYFKGIGNLDKETMTTVSGTKTTTTTLESKSAGWNLRVGIPFTLCEGSSSSSKSKSKAKTETKKIDCQQYRIQYRCRSTM